MNKDLFRSPAALLPLAALFWAIAAGATLADGRAARIASGCGVLAALLLAAAYLVRKYMHLRGYSPEFLLQVPIEALERAQTRLAALRREVARGGYSSRRAVRQAAHDVLRQEGVKRVLRVRVRAGEGGEPAFVLTTEKTFPLVHSSHWMRGHLHLGLSFAVLLVAHGGLVPRSPLGVGMLAVGSLVVVSGLVGIALWIRDPAVLTRLERDLSTEEACALDEHLGRKLEALLPRLEPPLAERVRKYAASPARTGQAALIVAGLAGASKEGALLEDALVLAGQRARVRGELKSLSRVRARMHAWRVVHLPLVVLLVALVVAHLWAIWRY